MRLVERERDILDSGLFACADMRARMGNQQRHFELLATFEFVDHSGDGFLPQRFVGRAEIDQVGIVRDDQLIPDSVCAVRKAAISSCA